MALFDVFMKLSFLEQFFRDQKDLGAPWLSLLKTGRGIGINGFIHIKKTIRLQVIIE